MADQYYERFIAETGLQISRATFYRLKKELEGGDTTRLSRIIARDSFSREQRRDKGGLALLKSGGNPEERPFIAYDGEGRNVDDKHLYVLLASSDKKHVYNPKGLSTEEALDFLLRQKDQKAIRIFYSFGYDVQQILRDLPDDKLLDIMHGQTVRWHGYKIQYLANKIFSVNFVRFYDVFAFWQTSFIYAVATTLGENSVSDVLRRGKESRGEFDTWNISEILQYTNEELDLLVKLAEHLREVFHRAGIKIGTAYYGPGSIANFLFKSNHVAPKKIENPTLVDVMERAYYGGRFETFKLGKVGGIWECDINSAYPAVIKDLPYLDDWKLKPTNAFPFATNHSVWHVQWEIPEGSVIGPFPSRDKHGFITYPRIGIGWYWKPEVDAAIEMYGRDCFTIKEGYIPETIEGRPFSWVQEIYDRRIELKEKNDPAQWALKLGLNSLYGKTAQRVGTAKYFSLAWAGYITSATRAKLLRASIGFERDIVAYATDAVYFNRLPRLRTSKGLGEWEVKHWDKGYFLQSGVYRLQKGEKVKDAYRGFSVRNGLRDLFEQIDENPYSLPYIYQVKFVGHLEAIKAPNALGPNRLKFIAVRKKIQPFKTTKRKLMDADALREFFASEEYAIGKVDWIFRNDAIGFTWDTGSLLRRSYLTTILENHNDHSSIYHEDYGPLEESYPFSIIATERMEEGTDEIAEERLGGLRGQISVDVAKNLVVLDEESVVKEFVSNG